MIELGRQRQFVNRSVERGRERPRVERQRAVGRGLVECRIRKRGLVERRLAISGHGRDAASRKFILQRKRDHPLPDDLASGLKVGDAGVHGRTSRQSFEHALELGPAQLGVVEACGDRPAVDNRTPFGDRVLRGGPVLERARLEGRTLRIVRAHGEEHCRADDHAEGDHGSDNAERAGKQRRPRTRATLRGVGLGFDLRFVAHEDGRLAARSGLSGIRSPMISAN